MLKIYGVPNSQPVRAVVWVCLMKGLPFEFLMTSQNRAAKQPDYLEQVNPRGTIPAIDDEGLILWESHAIMIYLCEKHGWTDLWPDKLEERATVNQYLHFHHRNTREVVIQWSRALWPALFDVKDPDEKWFARNTFPGMRNNSEVVANTLKIVDGMLKNDRFIAGENLTLADISAYEELGQNQSAYANCTDYTDCPNIRRWFDDMQNQPLHEEAHAIWRLLGDLNTVSGWMSTLAKANKEAARIFQQAQEKGL
jgi:glutathione S-transferase